ncbi:hypothetical protein QOM21_00810 [Streptomyces sp. Pv4-95]|uniref:hypothetical protein n=1 Tax=Streptomyces sp. Pv4-95 TaxID=3049543 RepID=UPI003892B263
MSDTWEPATAASVRAALESASRNLADRGLHSSVGSVPEWEGYAPVIGATPTEVFYLDVRLGPAPRRHGHVAHAVFQVFDPARPNLGLMLTYQADESGNPLDERRWPVFDISLDRAITFGLLPILETALGPLDATGQGKSVYAGLFHGRSTFLDMFYSAVVTTPRFVRGFHERGQLACLFVDFHVPLTEAMANVGRLLVGDSDVHWISATRTRSHIRIPVVANGAVHPMQCLSDAVDRAVRLTQEYADRHAERAMK